LAGCFRGTTPAGGRTADDLTDGECPRKADRLLDDTEFAAGLGATRAATRHLDDVGATFDQPDHIADEGRLTRPVWAEKCDTLPRLDSQIDSGESRDVTVSVNETSYYEHIFHLLPPRTPIMRNDRCGG
jgi:hypothetical protein